MAISRYFNSLTVLKGRLLAKSKSVVSNNGINSLFCQLICVTRKGLKLSVKVRQKRHRSFRVREKKKNIICI